ncbi:MAG: L-aspartate oxidase [Acidobacteriota bacterium]|nr:L-aspartate oxidase [Acidobacteriota bacterium]
MQAVDFLVVGGGIAGLRAAADLAKAGRVLIVTKESIAESNTAYAQGGIAVALGGEQDIALHLEDTLAAGDGLVDRCAAEVLVQEGPIRVDELLAWGTRFDRYAAGNCVGELMRTREGAHSLPRILHADGDATGRVIAHSLLRQIRALPSVEVMEWATAVDLIAAEERVVGVKLLDASGRALQIGARAVLLASGGAGQVYSDTTNPPVATGDGIAMAYRAGAELMDMEFYQFHPTAFAMPGAPRFLLSEALRGEGAWLVNARGERFMQQYDSRLELAPRDSVARAIAREMLDGRVCLDMREAGSRMDLTARFPGISAFLAGYGLHLAKDLIPVGPAAHYLMGGIRTDVHGRTAIPGLYAAGEAACTGVHGANRLASNSLLEGLVFGAKAAQAMQEDSAAATGSAPPEHSGAAPAETSPAPTLDAWILRLRELMWRDAGLLRAGAGLRSTEQQLSAMSEDMPQGHGRRAVEARNLHTVATAIVAAALGRQESRGAHFRTDFPSKAVVAQHSLLRQGVLRYC